MEEAEGGRGEGKEDRREGRIGRGRKIDQMRMNGKRKEEKKRRRGKEDEDRR